MCNCNKTTSTWTVTYPAGSGLANQVLSSPFAARQAANAVPGATWARTPATK